MITPSFYSGCFKRKSKRNGQTPEKKQEANSPNSKFCWHDCQNQIEGELSFIFAQIGVHFRTPHSDSADNQR